MGRRKDADNTVVAHVVSAVFAGAFLYAVNLPWFRGLPFIVEDELASILWLINLQLSIEIFVSALLVVYRPAFLYHLGRVATGLASGVVYVMLFVIFPVDFSSLSEYVDLFFRIAFAAGAIGSAISVLVHVIKFLLSLGPGDSGGDRVDEEVAL